MYPAEIALLEDTATGVQAAAQEMDRALRTALLQDAQSKIQSARAGLGDNLDFALGAGNLMS